jgi:hypothetical protein
MSIVCTWESNGSWIGLIVRNRGTSDTEVSIFFLGFSPTYKYDIYLVFTVKCMYYVQRILYKYYCFKCKLTDGSAQHSRNNYKEEKGITKERTALHCCKNLDWMWLPVPTPTVFLNRDETRQLEIGIGKVDTVVLMESWEWQAIVPKRHLVTARFKIFIRARKSSLAFAFDQLVE